MVLLLALVLVGKAQSTLFSEGFEEGIPDTWTVVDADGDTYTWDAVTASENHAAHTGTGFVSSRSWINNTVGGVHPDNWLISPAITIPSTGNYDLSLWVCAMQDDYPSEHFSVCILTNPNNLNQYETLYESTLEATHGGQPQQSQGYWQQVVVHLTGHTGTVYIAVRHHDCYDQVAICVDDIAVSTSSTDPAIAVSTNNISYGSGSIGSNFGRKQFNVSGMNLTSNVTLALPAGTPFGISTDTVNFSNTATLTPSASGDIVSTPIYVRFNPTTAGLYQSNITITSQAEPLTVSLEGLAVDCSQDQTLPWYETFTAAGFPSNCWTMTSTDTSDYVGEDEDGNPVVYPGVKRYTWWRSSANQYASVVGDTAAVQDEHLYTPTFDLSNASGAADFQFDLRTNPKVQALVDGAVRFYVKMSTDNGLNWTTIFNLADVRADFAANWADWSTILPVSFNMDQYLGSNAQIKFDFHYEADHGAADQVIIQNVKFTNYHDPRMVVDAEDSIITFFTYVGHPEAITIPVEGRNLSNPINVTTTAPFEVSTDGTTFAYTDTLPTTGGNLYVRYNPTTAVTGSLANLTISSLTTDTNVDTVIVLMGNSYDCSGIVLPITESFESIDSTVLAPNTTEYCWSAFKANTDDAQNDIINSNDYAYTGNQSLRFSSLKYNSQQIYDQYLISPELSATNPMLVMFNYANASALKDETFRVGYSTTGNAISDFTWENDIVNAANTDWHLYRNTNVPANVKYVAVQYKSQRQAYLYIDNFQIMEAPACMFPVELRAENTNANSANIAWTAGASETSWDVIYSTYPLDLTATPTTVNDTSTTLSNLTADTHYQMAVRANCGEGHSEWSEYADFWTTTTPATVPYTQTFEDNDPDRGNWVFVNNGQPNYFIFGNTNNWTTGKTMMITNNGSTNSYLYSVGDDQVSHYSTAWAYRDIEFTPTTAYGYLITLDWKCFGEIDYDFGELFIGNATEVTNFDRNENHPGFVDVNTAHYTPAGLTKLGRFVNKPQRQTAAYLIPAENISGTVQRLYFLWTNDSLSGAEQPLAVDNIDISIPQFATMTGTVTNDQTGVAIPYATINMVSSQGFTASVTADANGQYTIENIVVGSYSITVNANGYLELSTVYTLGEGSNNVDFQLTIQECTIMPTGVTYTIEDDNVVINWDAIESGIMTQATSETPSSSLGVDAGTYRMEAYHLFKPEHLVRFNGCTIDNVSFMFNSDPSVCTYTIKIYIGNDPTGEFGPASLLYERQIDPSEILDLSSWNTYAIDPIVVDATQPLWIGYKAAWENATGSNRYPCTYLASLNDGYGNILFFNDAWQTSGTNFGDWAIRANAIAPDYHYNVLEDGIVIANNLSDAEYIVSPGDPTACYQVQTICENGQISANSVCAQPSAINNVENNLSFEVYPNPAHETVNVSTTMDVQKVEVLNYLGQVIFSQNTTNNNFTLNVANYADGVYFIRLSGNDGIATQKLIKK